MNNTTASSELEPRDRSKTGVLSTLAKVGPTLIVLAVMATGWLAVHEINTGSHSEEGETEAEMSTPSDVLKLPNGKVEAAEFGALPAEIQDIQHDHTIPGRIGYDETKHVDVKAPLDGILAELLVMPGEQVQAGQLLAVLRSPEIGQARAEVLKRQQEREIAQQVLEREQALTRNLNEMAAMLDREEAADKIEAAFRDRALGAYRRDILSAYAKLQLVSELLAKIEPLASSGAVSGRVVRERQAEEQMARTEFRTAIDQATFASQQAKMKADAAVAEADRQLNLAWQAVETLLGYKVDKELEELKNEEALSRLEIRAPFTGSVESRGFAQDERVSRGDSLIVLANTDSLYVAASVRESDWSAVSIGLDTPVLVTVPALADRTFEARVRYFGREVQPETNSVPLVAKLANREGLLRPGMYVRVTIPMGMPVKALSVKPESVVQHEDQSFVFIQEDNDTFKKVDVAIGQASEDWIEVTQGLEPGQLVVTNGAFLLKSELLLKGEGE